MSLKHDSYAQNSSRVCTSITLTFPTAGLKISVSDASDKMSGVFGLGSDIFEMMPVALVKVCSKLELDMIGFDFLLFTTMAKRQGRPQAHKYNRVGQTILLGSDRMSDAFLSTTNNLTNGSDNVRDRPIF